MLHLPSVPLSVLLWLLAAGIPTRPSQILYPLLFPSSCVIPFFLFQCSLCMTRPTWRCTTSASPRSPSFSTAWSSNMSPWRHWRGIHPCIGTMKPSTSRRLYFWRRVCVMRLLLLLNTFPPCNWHQGHSKELPPPLARLHVLDMSGSIRRRHLLLWCLLSFRQHHFHQQRPGECVGELGWWRRQIGCAVCLMCPFGYTKERFLKIRHPSLLDSHVKI